MTNPITEATPDHRYQLWVTVRGRPIASANLPVNDDLRLVDDFALYADIDETSNDLETSVWDTVEGKEICSATGIAMQGQSYLFEMKKGSSIEGGFHVG